MQSLLSGDSLPEVWDRIKRTVPTSIINSAKLWPAVTAFSFTFIDAQYRSIFAGLIAIGWQTYLSLLNRRAEMAEAADKIAPSSESGEKKVIRQRDTQKIEA
jgi:protein Mpv17